MVAENGHFASNKFAIPSRFHDKRHVLWTVPPDTACSASAEGDSARGGSACDLPRVEIRIEDSLDGIDWAEVKADLAADDFDNGRSPDALRRSFERSQHVAIARDRVRVVGTARLLSDGVCNAYLLDVWTKSSHRRRGIASAMIRYLLERVPGQHVGLQTDDAQALYVTLGFAPQPDFYSRVVGDWLANDANR